jgi:hypothetical protein
MRVVSTGLLALLVATGGCLGDQVTEIHDEAREVADRTAEAAGEGLAAAARGLGDFLSDLTLGSHRTGQEGRVVLRISDEPLLPGDEVSAQLLVGQPRPPAPLAIASSSPEVLEVLSVQPATGLLASGWLALRAVTEGRVSLLVTSDGQSFDEIDLDVVRPVEMQLTVTTPAGQRLEDAPEQLVLTEGDRLVIIPQLILPDGTRSERRRGGELTLSDPEVLSHGSLFGAHYLDALRAGETEVTVSAVGLERRLSVVVRAR